VNETPATSPPRNASLAVLGMTCAMIGALALAFAAEYAFFKLAAIRNICESVQLKIRQPYAFLIEYRIVLWSGVAAGVGASFFAAFRFGGKPRAVAVNVGVLLAALILAWACWKSNLLPFKLVGEENQQRWQEPPGP